MLAGTLPSPERVVQAIRTAEQSILSDVRLAGENGLEISRCYDGYDENSGMTMATYVNLVDRLIGAMIEAGTLRQQGAVLLAAASNQGEADGVEVQV